MNQDSSTRFLFGSGNRSPRKTDSPFKRKVNKDFDSSDHDDSFEDGDFSSGIKKDNTSRLDIDTEETVINRKVVKRIEKEVSRIQYKIQTLKGKKTKNNKKTVLQMILPKEAIKKKREMINGLEKDLAWSQWEARHQRENDRNGFTPNYGNKYDNENLAYQMKNKKKERNIDQMYNLGEELVRKLKHYDMDRERMFTKPNEISKKLMKKDMNFKPEIVDSRSNSRNLSIKERLNKNLSVKSLLEESNNSSRKGVAYSTDHLKNPSFGKNKHTNSNIVIIDSADGESSYNKSNTSMSNNFVSARNLNPSLGFDSNNNTPKLAQAQISDSYFSNRSKQGASNTVVERNKMSSSLAINNVSKPKSSSTQELIVAKPKGFISRNTKEQEENVFNFKEEGLLLDEQKERDGHAYYQRDRIDEKPEVKENESSSDGDLSNLSSNKDRGMRDPVLVPLGEKAKKKAGKNIYKDNSVRDKLNAKLQKYSIKHEEDEDNVYRNFTSSDYHIASSRGINNTASTKDSLSNRYNTEGQSTMGSKSFRHSNQRLTSTFNTNTDSTEIGTKQTPTKYSLQSNSFKSGKSKFKADSSATSKEKAKEKEKEKTGKTHRRDNSKSSVKASFENIEEEDSSFNEGSSKNNVNLTTNESNTKRKDQVKGEKGKKGVKEVNDKEAGLNEYSKLAADSKDSNYYFRFNLVKRDSSNVYPGLNNLEKDFKLYQNKQSNVKLRKSILNTIPMLFGNNVPKDSNRIPGLIHQKLSTGRTDNNYESNNSQNDNLEGMNTTTQSQTNRSGLPSISPAKQPSGSLFNKSNATSQQGLTAETGQHGRGVRFTANPVIIYSGNADTEEMDDKRLDPSFPFSVKIADKTVGDLAGQIMNNGSASSANVLLEQIKKKAVLNPGESSGNLLPNSQEIPLVLRRTSLEEISQLDMIRFQAMQEKEQSDNFLNRANCLAKEERLNNNLKASQEKLKHLVYKSDGLCSNLEHINKRLAEILADRDSCKAMIVKGNKEVERLDLDIRSKMTNERGHKRKTHKHGSQINPQLNNGSSGNRPNDSNSKLLQPGIRGTLKVNTKFGINIQGPSTASTGQDPGRLAQNSSIEKLKTLKKNTLTVSGMNADSSVNTSTKNIGQQDYSNDMKERKHYLMQVDECKERQHFIEHEIKISTFLKDAYKQDIEKVTYLIEMAKTEISNIKRELELHYHELLIEGRESRNVGLSWLMITIWNLGSEVYMSYLPNFLDPLLVEYLFLRSHKEIELGKCEQLLDYMKGLVRTYRGVEYRKKKSANIKVFTKSKLKSSHDTFKGKFNLKRLYRDLIQDDVDLKSSMMVKKKKNEVLNTEDLSILHKSTKFELTVQENGENLNITSLNKQGASDYLETLLEHNKQITIKDVNHYLTHNNVEIQGEFNYLIKYVKQLESIEAEIRKDLSMMKENEIQRIGKEFLSNDYERIYRVNINTIFSVIVGQQNLFNEMKRFLSEKQNYYRSLELCRNYNVFSSKYEKIYTSLFDKNTNENGNM